MHDQQRLLRPDRHELCRRSGPVPLGPPMNASVVGAENLCPGGLFTGNGRPHYR